MSKEGIYLVSVQIWHQQAQIPFFCSSANSVWSINLNLHFLYNFHQRSVSLLHPPGEVFYLVGGNWFVVALECIDCFGVAQSSPLVPLDRVSLCQHFQLLCDGLVVIFLLGVGRLGTNPLAGRLGHCVRTVTVLL